MTPGRLAQHPKGLDRRKAATLGSEDGAHALAAVGDDHSHGHVARVGAGVQSEAPEQRPRLVGEGEVGARHVAGDAGPGHRPAGLERRGLDGQRGAPSSKCERRKACQQRRRVGERVRPGNGHPQRGAVGAGGPICAEGGQLEQQLLGDALQPDDQDVLGGATGSGAERRPGLEQELGAGGQDVEVLQADGGPVGLEGGAFGGE